MVQAVQVTKWYSFDKKEHDTRALAEKHEAENFHEVLGAASPAHILASANDEHSGPVAEAILKAASMIRKRRRSIGIPDAQPAVDP